MKIHHLALTRDWAEALESGTYRVSTLGMDLDEVGFIHCSRPEQVDGVFQRFYADVAEPIVLLTIETDRLSSPWQLDDVPGEPLTFPHIYGPLNASAVESAEPFRGSASS